MQTSIAKWGNSLALRLPRHVVEGANLKEGASVVVEVQDGNLVIKPARKKFKLAELVAAIQPANRHDETDWGTRQGAEEW